MTRRKGLLYAVVRAGVQAQREAEKRQIAQQRAQSRAALDAERAQQAYLRAANQTSRAEARYQKEHQKEQARLYEESRRANVAWLNDQLERDIAQLSSILTDTLGVDDYFNLDTLKEKAQVPVFQPGRLAEAEQPPRLVAPEEPAGIKRFMPGAKEKHAEEVARAQQRYETELTAYNYREAARQQALNEIWSSYQQQVAGIHEKVAAQHAEIDKLKQDFAKGVPDAIVTYFMLVLEASNYPIDFPQQAKLAYVPESKQLVVEYELPPYDRVPTIGSYKYVKAKDEIAETPRPPTQRKALYASVVAQVTIRTLHELFEADRLGHLDTIVFNGYVNAVDPGTGQTVQPHLVTVRTTRDIFNQLDLRRVDPIACLTKLNASVSKKPDELAPVRPVVEFNMVDPRFIEETDVLSTLDQRPNLMELTPSEFEALISNLFQAMGLETRLTQASRDGGVDCVAYDSRPILGGKVVIQAKRYKNTVAVSAVRDLFGTVQNEGASKGILVTTSGYGKAAFEFAEGKPLELLSGSNLLYLLAEHAGLEARIEVPDNWKDPHPDSGSI